MTRARTAIVGVAVTAAVLVLAPGAALAEVPAETAAASLPLHARMLLPRCPTQPFDEVDLVATLRVELLSHGTELSQQTPEGLAPDRVALIIVDAPDCDGNDVRIRIENLGTDRSVRRRLDLGDRPIEERGRVLALAIAELLRTRWSELGVPEVAEPVEPEPEEEEAEPEPEPAAPPVDEDGLRRRAAREAVGLIDRREEQAADLFRRIRLDLTMIVRGYPTVQGGLFGGQLGLSFQLSRRVPLRLRLDGTYGNGGGSTSRGFVRIDTALGGLGLFYEGGVSRIRGSIGPHLEMGYGWVKGEPTAEGVDSASFGGFLLTVELVGGIRVRLGARVLLLVDVTAGYVAVGLEPNVEGRAVGGIARATLGANVGLTIEI